MHSFYVNAKLSLSLALCRAYKPSPTPPKINSHRASVTRISACTTVVNCNCACGTTLSKGHGTNTTTPVVKSVCIARTTSGSPYNTRRRIRPEHTRFSPMTYMRTTLVCIFGQDRLGITAPPPHVHVETTGVFISCSCRHSLKKAMTESGIRSRCWYRWMDHIEYSQFEACIKGHTFFKSPRP